MGLKEEKEFTKGFNHGYMLGKHDPGLLALMLRGQPEGHDYLDGLREGGKQHARELERERIKADIKRGGQGPEKGRGKSR